MIDDYKLYVLWFLASMEICVFKYVDEVFFYVKMTLLGRW